MLHLSFRTKLLLAMMLVVTAVSVAILLVAQQRVRRSYETMFRTQFERQIGYFTALQESRLGAIEERCLSFTKSVRLVAQLAEPDVNSTNLYGMAVDELRQVGAMMPGLAQGRATAPFARFLDANGKVIVPPEELKSSLFNPRRDLEPQLKMVREALTGEQLQQVGYLALPPETNRADSRVGLRRVGKARRPERRDDEDLHTLQEVIVTKIVDPATDHVLGVLVLGFPILDLMPQRKRLEQASGITNRLDLIRTGVLIEDKLYADATVIPESLGEAVTRKIADHVAATKIRQADFSCEIGGSHYRVFYELMSDSKAFPPAYQICLYSMDEAVREQRALVGIVVMLGGGGLLLAFGLSLFISRSLSSPVHELVGGTDEIRRGNFQVRVPVRSRDELGKLASSFNEMAGGLAQREKYRTILNMVADKKVAQRLMEEGKIELGGELREVTVLFCDIRGFTALTQNMPPGEVIEMLNEHMTALTRIVHANHGTLDKFVGDLLMAVFGAPSNEGDDTANACHCALEIIQTRSQMNRTSRFRLEIGVGLATGTVVAGNMGAEGRCNYTVLGERVNLASRLCDKAVAGEVLIDEHTRGKLGSQIMVEPAGQVELKGFASLVPVFRLTGIVIRPPSA